MNTEETLFELLRVGLGAQTGLSHGLTEEEWAAVFAAARKQSVLGVAYAGVCRLPESMRPAEELMMMWTGLATKIQEQNRRMNGSTKKVADNFRAEGFKSAVMKGQALAALYGPLALLRQSGDVDVILDASRDRIVKYVTDITPKTHIMSHHIDFPVNRNVSIEVHFKPTEMCNPFTQKRLMRWYRRNYANVYEHTTLLPDGAELACPAPAFNLVFVLLHLYKHLFAEGVGLRQLMDYYFVLTDALERVDDATWREAAEAMRELHIKGVAQAVLWLMQRIFAMPKQRLDGICKKLNFGLDAAEGEWLLNDVMKNGNMGHGRENWFRPDDSPWLRFRKMVAANVRLLVHYPEETLWFPFFKMWHYPWRRYMEIKWKLK